MVNVTLRVVKWKNQYWGEISKIVFSNKNKSRLSLNNHIDLVCRCNIREKPDAEQPLVVLVTEYAFN
jgi:hypothetical protein